MKKYILFVLLLACSLASFAQSSMTDTQVMEFVQKEHKRGTSQAQIVTKLMQSGVDISQIRRVRATYEKMQKVMLRLVLYLKAAQETVVVVTTGRSVLGRTSVRLQRIHSMTTTIVSRR